MTSDAFDPSFDADGLRQIYLEPGMLHCCAEPAVIRTVLGSCVAVCLLDRHGRAAGMNHYVLPSSSDGQSNRRYGDFAIGELILGMNRLGCGVGDLRAKVFGGAAVLPFGVAEDSVGVKNVAIALSMLRSHAIPIVARRTGGEKGLLIRLFTETGEVMVRPITGTAGAMTAGRMPPGRVAVHDSRCAGSADDMVWLPGRRIPMPS